MASRDDKDGASFMKEIYRLFIVVDTSLVLSLYLPFYGRNRSEVTHLSSGCKRLEWAIWYGLNWLFFGDYTLDFLFLTFFFLMYCTIWRWERSLLIRILHLNGAFCNVDLLQVIVIHSPKRFRHIYEAPSVWLVFVAISTSYLQSRLHVFCRGILLIHDGLFALSGTQVLCTWELYWRRSVHVFLSLSQQQLDVTGARAVPMQQQFFTLWNLNILLILNPVMSEGRSGTLSMTP